MTPISIGITTRNRPRSLEACLASIRRVLGAHHDVMVFDDVPDGEAAAAVTRGWVGAGTVRILTDPPGAGQIVGRNRIVQHARHELVLLLDDDTVLLEARGIESAMDVLRRDVTVAAVAFAQADADGRPWPDGMQPAAARTISRVASFIGFAHLVRRSTFLALGGYRENLVFYGEEKEFCRRVLGAGLSVVYLPEGRVAHVQDPMSRDRRRQLRYMARNDCLTSLYNDPAPLAAAAVPLALWRYRKHVAGLPAGDRGGLRWLAGELWALRHDIRAGRRALSWRAMRQWRRLRGAIPYVPPS